MNYSAIAETIPPRTGSGTQEWIYQVLRFGIVSGQLKPGMQLKQDEISDSLNVSHIPVREALRQLEAQHLVTIHPNRGASVSSLSRDKVIEMVQVLDAIRSTMLLKQSILQMDDAVFSKLEESLIAQKNCQDAFSFESLNNEYHRILVFLSCNSFAEELSEMIHANIGRYLRGYLFSTPDDRAEFIALNEQLLEACKAKDLNKAGTLMGAKIDLAMTKLPDSFV